MIPNSDELFGIIQASRGKGDRLLLVLPFFEMERSGRVFRQDSNRRKGYVDVSISFDFYGSSS
jgi:hypothetical protein